MVVKSLNNFTNAKPNGPHDFKEDLKIKYDATLAIVGKVPNNTGPMTKLLEVVVIPLTWANYYVMPVAEQLSWEEKGDASTKATLLLMNSKNDNAKKYLQFFIRKETNQLIQLPLKEWQDICPHNIQTNPPIIHVIKGGTST